MSFELFYTSVPQGLRPGSKGFCTVGVTRGTPSMLVERLEALSGYRPLYSVGSPQANQNPVGWAHFRVAAGGQTYSVLSRVCFAGTDYTQRSNKFAHHLVPTTAEQPAGGPAWLLSQPGIMATRWVGEPAEYDLGPGIPIGDLAAAPCAAWQSATGDAGWAGVLVDAFVTNPSTPAYVIYSPGADVLRLISEAVALIPAQQRWQVTFNTYFTDLPAGVTCAWRCCIAGTPAAEEARQSGGTVIDLTARLPRAPDDTWTAFARTGVSPYAKPAEHDELEMPAIDVRDDEPDPLPITPRRSASRTLAAAAPARRAAAAPVELDEPDLSWMPPPEATVVESSEPPAAGFIRRPNWALILGVLAVWTIVVAWISSALTSGHVANQLVEKDQQIKAELEAKDKMKADLDASGPKVDALNASIKDWERRFDAVSAELAKARDDASKAEPDPAKWISIDKHRVAIDDARRAQKEADAKAPAEMPAVVPSAVEGKLPVTPATDSKAAAAALQPLDGAGHYWLNADKLAAANDGITLVTFPEGIDAKLQGFPGDEAGASKAIIKADAGKKEIQILRSVPATGETQTLCTFTVANGELRVKWPRLAAATDDGARKESLKNVLLTAGTFSIQFVEPQSMLFNLYDDKLESVSGVATPKAAGGKLSAACRKLKLSILPPHWRWSNESEESPHLVMAHESIGDLQIGLHLDPAKGLISSTWHAPYDARLKEQALARQTYSDTEKLAKSGDKTAAGNLDARKAELNDKAEVVTTLEAIDGTALVETASGLVLYQVKFNVRQGTKK